MQIRDEVKGLQNGREFSQPFECLYQDMETQDKKFSIAFMKKLSRALVQSLIKREILTSREVLLTKLVRVISPCFAKRCFPKYGFFVLKLSAQAKKN